MKADLFDSMFIIETLNMTVRIGLLLEEYDTHIDGFGSSFSMEVFSNHRA